MRGKQGLLRGLCVCVIVFGMVTDTELAGRIGYARSAWQEVSGQEVSRQEVDGQEISEQEISGQEISEQVVSGQETGIPKADSQRIDLQQDTEEKNALTDSQDVTKEDAPRELVYYYQTDERYADKLFGTDPIGRYGCGPTVMAMAISTLTDITVDPVYMAQWAYKNGYWAKGSGAYHTIVSGAAKGFGLKSTSCGRKEVDSIIDALQNGKLVIALMGKGQFTDSGHFILMHGLTKEGKILLADPFSEVRSSQEWDLAVIQKEAKEYAVAEGPFWILEAE